MARFTLFLKVELIFNNSKKYYAHKYADIVENQRILIMISNNHAPDTHTGPVCQRCVHMLTVVHSQQLGKPSVCLQVTGETWDSHPVGNTSAISASRFNIRCSASFQRILHRTSSNSWLILCSIVTSLLCVHHYDIHAGSCVRFNAEAQGEI